MRRRQPQLEWAVSFQLSSVDRRSAWPVAVALQTAAILSLGSISVDLAYGADLPVPCGGAACGPNGPSAWVTSGNVSAVSDGNSLTIDQQSDRAVLNWQRFNISADGTVIFHQPGTGSVALNRIFQGDPVRILGTLQANGSIYLINQNGIVFGSGARVNVGGLTASTLDLAPQAVDNLLDAAKQLAPAFRGFVDANGAVASGDLEVAAGAQLTAAAGQMLLLGANVTNQGTLSAPGGQVVLAAGDSVYVAPSFDPNLRGLLVEVGQGGRITNGSTGVVSAERGNVTLAGLLLNQEGRVSATTSVRENGSIRLLARDGASIAANGEPKASHGGELRLGAGSVTAIALAHNDDDKSVDATQQARSFIELEGRTISLEAHSLVSAPSGIVQVTARATPIDVSAFPSDPADGRIVLAADAKIDVSGAQIDRSVDTNVLRVELRGSQLADSPEQRDGALRGKAVFVDIRRSGTRADGTTWQGSPIGDLAGDIATIQKTVEERSLKGGEIHLAATGAVLLESGSALNVSGGAINFAGGVLNTTQVLGADGRVYDIGDADRDRQYAGIANAYAVQHTKWGVTETFATYGPSAGSRYEPGYVEGKDAGSIAITAPRVALDGSMIGQTTAGIHQRSMPTTVSAAALYRPVDQLPLAARLTLGVATSSGTGGAVTPDVRIEEGLVLDGLAGSSNGRFNPLIDPLSDELAAVRVRPDLFGAGGLGALSIYANGTVSLRAGTSLNLPFAGDLTVRAGAIDLEGSVVAPGGSVALTAAPTISILPGTGLSQITLGTAASIDVAGRWVNDAPAPLAPTQHDPIAIDGGSVAIAAREGAGLDLRAGSLIDVSGGAHRFANGSIKTGIGGNVTIEAAAVLGQPVPINVRGQLRAYSFTRGGRLSLTLNSLCLADFDCTGGDPNTSWIDVATYASDGFSSLTFRSNLGGVDVLASTLIQPRQRNYLWARDISLTPSGTPLAAFTQLGILPAELRLPVDLTLVASPQLAGGGSVDATNFASLGILSVGAGATITLDVGGLLALRSSSTVVVDGTLSAPAGGIEVTVTNDLPLQGPVASQGISLNDGARLLANGAVRALTDDLGQLRGSVLDGGSITLRANRGYVATAQSSVLDVSGTQADLVTGQTAVGGAAQSQQVASAGGSIVIAASEGLLLNGALSAHGGDGPASAGGRLQVLLDGNLHGQEPFGVTQPVFPYAARELHIVGGGAPEIIGAGSSLPDSLSGHGFLSANRLMGGDFSSIELGATNLYDALNPAGTAVPVSTGSIHFDTSLTLQADARLRLNAPRIVGAAGSQIGLSASYVGLGYDDVQQNAQTGGDAFAGTSVLNVTANLVDFIGTLGLDGFATANIRSTGDIRLRGVQPLSTGAPAGIAGLLHAAGSVDFTAQQVYAATLTEFSVLLDGPDHNVLSIHTASGQPGALLSAGSRLTLSADEIVQAGVLRAPFGEIVLQADRLQLAAGSVTSTSGAGSVVPFGTLQVGRDWTYQLPQGQTALYTDSGPPAQRIGLEAKDLIVDAGATLDLRGGGEMLGYEFVPGVTGTKDVLANQFSSSQFAIVPKLGLRFAPIDPSAQVGFGFQAGDSVYLSGYGDLAAGEYAILPARYALLPGAYLVRPVNGYTDIRPDESVTRLDGSVVISGYRTIAGSNVRDSRTSGFALLTGDQLRSNARYDLTTADGFFAAQPGDTQTSPPRLPRDSGQLQLIATASLDLAGRLQAAAGTGGRGALVDVVATRLQVIGAGDAADPSAVVIDAKQLDALGAESLLLGGLRTLTVDGTRIDTNTEQLTIGGAVTLQAPTLTLVARDQLEIESGASLRASGAAVSGSRDLLLSGPGAMVRVSTAPQPNVVRSDATGAGGNLLIGAGALISSRGSALLEATGTVDARPVYDLAGGSLAFSVSQLAVGDAGAAYPGLALSAQELSSLGLAELSLTSRSGIEFFGNTSLDVNGRVLLQTPSLLTNAAATAAISAHEIVVSGTPNAGTAPTLGDGTLRLTADELTFGGGQFATAGFGSLDLSATSRFRAAGSGQLSSAAAVRITAPVVTVGNGVDFGLMTLGTIDILGAGGTNAPTAMAAGSGGSLLFHGSRVTLATAIEAPSGLVALIADGTEPLSVALEDGARVDVSGVGLTFDGQTASGDGGLLRIASGHGGVRVSAGAVVDISAGNGAGNAGTLDVRAPTGTIDLAGTLRAQSAAGAGGSVALDGYAIPDLGVVNKLLNAGGATGARLFHQRGPGDLIVSAAAESTVRATNISIEADQGSVIVLGRIDASGASGGSIKLAARNDVDVYGFLLANASADAAEGGRVDLWSQNGGVYLRNAGAVSVAGGAVGLGGRVDVRASRDSLLTVVDADVGNDRVLLGAGITGNRELLVEGYQSYTVANGTIDASYTAAVAANPLYADAALFMQSAAALETALGNGATPSLVQAGIELQSSQNLLLNADWNLAAWRFDGRPGVLTLRAAGDLTVNRSLSDGFAAISGTGAFDVAALTDRSWSYRLVAGADLGASDMLAVAGAGGANGNLRVAGGTISTSTRAAVPVMIRTGTGDIDLAAAANLVLTNRASVIYTAGHDSGLGIALPLLGAGANRYPTDGGDIRIDVGGDVIGAPTNQLVTAWLWRAGRRTGLFAPSATGWNVNFQRFEQGVGALAGGDVVVRAGGNIRDLSASTVTIGRQIGGTTVASSIVEQIGGGRLEVESGGDITGGVYFDGRGAASLRSRGTIGINTATGSASTLAPTIALGDTVFDVKARRDLTLEAVLNPFLVPQATTQPGAASSISFFSTYTDRSALHATSMGGDINLLDNPFRVGGLAAAVGSSMVIGRGTSGFLVYPGTVTATALAGDLALGGKAALWPSSSGTLEFLVNGNVDLARGVSVADTNPATLFSIDKPEGDLADLAPVLATPLPGVAHVPIHSAAVRADGQDDPNPVRIVATGDIKGANLSYVAKPLRLVAGGDIVDLYANIQQLSDDSVSLISAGGDIFYQTPRDPLFGTILPSNIGVQVEGPGALLVQAGGSIDLGTSKGVTSAGNLANPALAANGANIALLAGVGNGSMQIGAFEQKYLVSGNQYDALLAEFVARYGGAMQTKSAQLEALRQMTADVRYELAQSILFAEIRAGGRAAAAAGANHGDYSRAFTAIDTLFPGNTVAEDSTTPNPYSGDISLFFSRVYTLAGGSISLVAPGGEVNVGLATPPAAFGVTKPASELGIVAQRRGDVDSLSYRDFQVNESRVFAADGGDILVWSTQGDIDAGRGAKTAIAAPAPTITFDASGNIQTVFPAALTGSGIQALSTSEGTKAGAVDLFAPRGVVNAGDAGIVAGNLTIGATAVLGADNISVSGTSVGVPVDTGGFGAALTGASSVAAGATNAADNTVAQSRQEQTSSTPLADQALGFLDVFVTGFGEPCDPAKQACENNNKQ